MRGHNTKPGAGGWRKNNHPQAKRVDFAGGWRKFYHLPAPLAQAHFVAATLATAAVTEVGLEFHPARLSRKNQPGTGEGYGLVNKAKSAIYSKEYFVKKSSASGVVLNVPA